MRFVTYTDNEYARLAPYLRTLLRSGALDANGHAELLERIVQCPAIVAPPRLRSDAIGPEVRGPHRRIVRALGREMGTFVLLLSCGHVVGRQTENKRGAYCEACLHCVEDDEGADAAPPLLDGDGWVSVTDRLPPCGTEVLMVIGGQIYHGHFAGSSFSFATPAGHFLAKVPRVPGDPITYWYPVSALPPIPEGAM